MSTQKISILSVLAFVAGVSAHGHVSNVKVGATSYAGQAIEWFYAPSITDSVGWAARNQDNGFVAPSAFGTSDIVCHKEATNGKLYATVAAGETLSITWNTWPSSHKGPIIDYLADCKGDCATVDKTTLEFFKIAEAGLVSGANLQTGKWATEKLLDDNLTWQIKIPSTLKAGKYVLRHELWGLHSAAQADGAQSYPSCINLEVTGSGTAVGSGTLGTKLYTATDPGVKVDIYQTTPTYTIPGPALWDGAGTTSSSTTGSGTRAAVSSAVSTSTKAAATPSSTAPTSTSTAEEPIVVVAAAPTTSITPTIKTAAATATSTSGTDADMPAGTTLDDLLQWLSAKITEILNGTATVSKRSHARDVKSVN